MAKVVMNKIYVGYISKDWEKHIHHTWIYSIPTMWKNKDHMPFPKFMRKARITIEEIK